MQVILTFQRRHLWNHHEFIFRGKRLEMEREKFLFFSCVTNLTQQIHLELLHGNGFIRIFHVQCNAIQFVEFDETLESSSTNRTPNWMWHPMIVKLVYATYSSILLTLPLTANHYTATGKFSNEYSSMCIWIAKENTKTNEHFVDFFEMICHSLYIAIWMLWNHLRLFIGSDVPILPKCSSMEIEQEVIKINIKWPSRTIHILIHTHNSKRSICTNPTMNIMLLAFMLLWLPQYLRVVDFIVAKVKMMSMWNLIQTCARANIFASSENVENQCKV